MSADSKLCNGRFSDKAKRFDALWLEYRQYIGRQILQTTTFIQRVIVHTLHDSVTSTLERKISHTELRCRIKLDREIVRI